MIRFTRREFMAGMFALPVPLVAGLARSSLAPQQAGPAVRSGRWRHSTAEFQRGQHAGVEVQTAGDGALTLAPGTHGAGVYTSPALRADFAFNAVAATWRAVMPPDASLALAARTSDDGANWGEWQPLEESQDLRDSRPQRVSSLIVAGGQYLQWRAELAGVPSARLSELTLIYIDSTQLGGRAISAPVAEPAAGAATGVTAPSITPRSGWACPEPYGSPNWLPAYRRVEKIVIHHTANNNTYPDGPTVLRAIWQYHAIDLDWGDIGYNFLIDRFGRIYEGRFGGADVIAGHALCYNPGSVGIGIVGDFRYTPTPSIVQAALTRLLAWLAYRSDIYPLGESYFVDRVLHNVCTHRDLQNSTANSGKCNMVTACPGDELYKQVYSYHPTPSELAWGLFPQYGAGWLDHNTPAAMVLGHTVTVDMQVINRGRLMWTEQEAPPVHVGYHWHKPDGTQYLQEPADDHRTPFSAGVAYGQTAGIAALLTAPPVPGAYTLKWDLVEEGVTWFAKQGVSTLDVPISVVRPTLAVAPSALLFMADSSGDPAGQALMISSNAPQPLHWRATSDQPWCIPGAAEGESETSLQVTVLGEGLEPGHTYSAAITLLCDAAENSPLVIGVQLVYSAQPLERSLLPLVSG